MPVLATRGRYSVSHSDTVHFGSASILLARVIASKMLALLTLESEQDVCADAHATRTHSSQYLYLMGPGTAIMILSFC